MKNRDYPLYEVKKINNLKELVNFTAEKYGDRPAFTFERKKETVSISYRQFKSDVDALGTILYDLGIQNTKVAVIGENSYEWILTYFAVTNSGNVIVPMDRELPAEDVENQVTNAGAEIFVFSDAYADISAYLQENTVTIRHFINMQCLMELVEQGGKLISQGNKHVVDYPIDNHTMCALLYTSGTTGTAKGVMLSHGNLASDTVSACQLVMFFGSNMLVLPLHHSFGFTAACNAVLLHGSEVFINSSLKNILADFKEYKPSNLFMVPLLVESLYKKVWDLAKKQGKDRLLLKLISVSNSLMRIKIDFRRVIFKSILSAFGGNLKLIVTGGAPIDDKYINGFRDFGINVLNGYGITECSPIVSVNRNNYFRDGSVGKVLACCKVKILEPDEYGHGEICVKGENVMLGYFNDECSTKEAFAGEWFRTGDIGYISEDDFLFISGRKKNLIILGNGKNIYPEELELKLLSIQYVKEAAVFAEENTIIAEVFLDPECGPDCVSRLSGDILCVNRTLPLFMNISKTVVRDAEFPKTTTKKIKRQYR